MLIGMKQISFEGVEERDSTLLVRNQREDLIAQIIDQTNLLDTDRKRVAERLAIEANMCGWSNFDLHALLQKKHDPNVKNYTGLVISYAYPKKKWK